MSRAQEYRLRSFEAGYVLPLLDYFGTEGLRYIETVGEPNDPTGDADLRVLLLKEASNWVDMGRWCGYFSPDLEPVTSQVGRFDPQHIHFSYRHLNDRMQDRISFGHLFNGEPQPSVVEDFGESLRVAMEDLTDDRVKFLRLFLFASDAEWKDQMAVLREILRGLDYGVSDIPENVMDEVTWAFQGPESDLESQITAFPSDWRIGANVYEARTDSSRSRELESYRRGIENLALRMLDFGMPRDLSGDERIVRGLPGEGNVEGGDDSGPAGPGKDFPDDIDFL